MITDRWADRVAFLAVDVVSKHGHSDNVSSSRRCVSGVNSGEGSGIHENVADSGSNTMQRAMLIHVVIVLIFFCKHA